MAIQNPTAARCQHPRAVPQPHGDQTATQAAASAPCVGTPVVALFDLLEEQLSKVIMDASLCGHGWSKINGDGTMTRVSLDESWSKRGDIMQDKNDIAPMPVSAQKSLIDKKVLANNERWVPLQEQYRKALEMMRDADAMSSKPAFSPHPMAPSIEMLTLKASIADDIAALINASPRSPTKEQIGDVVMRLLQSPGPQPCPQQRWAASRWAHRHRPFSPRASGAGSLGASGGGASPRRRFAPWLVTAGTR